MEERTRKKLTRNKTFRQMMETDPSYLEQVAAFSFEEVPKADPAIDERSRALAIAATVMGCQGIDFYRQILLDGALSVLHPIEVKEVLYQATAYLGLARIYPFIEATNEVLKKRGIKLPLPEQGTTTSENRREKGTAAQVASGWPPIVSEITTPGRDSHCKTASWSPSASWPPKADASHSWSATRKGISTSATVPISCALSSVSASPISATREA